MKFTKHLPRSRKPLMRKLWHRGGRMWHDVVTQHDAPHRIALGFAIGFLIGWMPIVGVQMLCCLLLSWLLRANFLATLPGVWMSNPLTMVPMYWLENRVGAIFAGKAINMDAMGEIWGKVALKLEEFGFWSGTWEGTKLLFTEFLPVTVAMLIGGLILGLINASIVYYPSLRMVQRYHERRQARVKHWGRISQRSKVVKKDEPDDEKNVDHDKEAV